MWLQSGLPMGSEPLIEAKIGDFGASTDAYYNVILDRSRFIFCNVVFSVKIWRNRGISSRSMLRNLIIDQIPVCRAWTGVGYILPKLAPPRAIKRAIKINWKEADVIASRTR
jgi:hypothetical protein